MYKLTPCLIFLACGALACTSVPAPTTDAPDDSGQSPATKSMLPAHPLPGERHGAGKGDQFDDFRLANPNLYGITAAPKTPLRAVGQFDDHQALLLTWTGNFPDVYAGIVGASKPVIDIYVVHEGNLAKQQFQNAMFQHGVSTSGLNYFNMSNDSIWMRDYGPLSARAPDGTVAFVDPRYYHQRVFDDALPTKIANSWGITTYRQPLSWEGGTYIADGHGNCVYSQGVYWYGGTSQEKIHQYQEDYLGCTSNIVIKPLSQEGTTHSDMFAKAYAPGKYLLGEYQSWQDFTNKQILDDDAAILEGAGMEVTRLPMPSNSNKTLWRTYANSLFVNGVNLVPVYTDDTAFEDEAMAVWEAAMPTWDHVKIDSTELITWAGAVHCITMTVPSGALDEVEADPPLLCSGDFDCFPTNTQAGSCSVGFEGCCTGTTLSTCDAGGVTTADCGGQGCGWSDTTLSYQCGGSGAGPISNAPLACGAECVPDCAGKACGSDGCGGSCGTCAGGATCVAGQCQEPTDPCQGISFEGCCDGNVLKWCQDTLQTQNCQGSCGWQAGQAYYNCGFSGSDPSGQHPKACPSECTPDCTGKTCGDDGCGGSCGACGGGETCTGGQCVCAPDCTGKTCGDDGCGGSCGACDQGQECTANQCVAVCVPDCDGAQCGSDGCGGVCGACDAGDVCNADKQCETPSGCGDVTFEGQCNGNVLTWCQDDELHTFDCAGLGAFECKAEPDTDPPSFDCLPTGDECTPNCAGQACGSDGCGGVCGTCAEGSSCVEGQCQGPVDPCNGLTWEGCCDGAVLNYCDNNAPVTVNCGGAGCGWDAGNNYYNCNFSGDGPAEFPKECGAAACEPDCTGKICGSDGCGGTCGTCTDGLTCEAGQCVDACQGLTYEGQCEGDVLSFCNGGQIASGDCAEFGGCCGWDPGGGYFDCLEGDACTTCEHGCAAGDTGCNAAGTHAWTCATADNGCLAPEYSTCASGECDATTGQCVGGGPPPCDPVCTGKQCGDDGCGGSCGTCAAGESCNADGQCVAGCAPSCEGKVCGSDGCGGSCGDCAAGAETAPPTRCATRTASASRSRRSVCPSATASSAAPTAAATRAGFAARSRPATTGCASTSPTPGARACPTWAPARGTC